MLASFGMNSAYYFSMIWNPPLSLVTELEVSKRSFVWLEFVDVDNMFVFHAFVP